MLATAKQVSFLRSLLEQREHDVRLTPDQLEGLSIQSASNYIGILKQYPVRQQKSASADPLANVPEGRYAVDGADGQTIFLRLDKPTEGRWAGFTFGHIQAGDNFHKGGMARPGGTFQGPLAAAVTKVATDPKAAAIRYGRELGICAVCGRALTDEDSRAAGIGPVCAKRF